MHTHTHTHQIKSLGEKRFLRSFPQINLLFLEEERRQIGSSLKREARGEQRQRYIKFRKKAESKSAWIPWEENSPISPEPTQLGCSNHHSTLRWPALTSTWKGRQSLQHARGLRQNIVTDRLQTHTSNVLPKTIKQIKKTTKTKHWDLAIWPRKNASKHPVCNR